MQQRPDGDPTSWAYQAAIHGTHAASPPPGANACKHGSWFFVSWHRMYLLHFEEIVRAAVVEVGGPADWALPYWNYGLDGEHARLPEAFRAATVDGQPNPLFVAERAPGINAGAQIPPAVTTAALALSRPEFVGSPQFGGGTAPSGPQFEGRTGRLEQTPHNDIHVAVGGRGGWMADPDMAALDPIFWLHHGNIDRLWDEWSSTGAHADPTDAAWAGTSFDFFDAAGDPVSHTCGDVTDIAALGYTYDTSPTRTEELAVTAAPPPGEPEDEAEMVGASEHPVQLTGSTEKVPVTIDARASEDTLELATERRIYLNVEDIRADENPGSVYGVYVNLPDDAPADLVAEHHAGNVSFFGIERAQRPKGDEEGHGLKVTLDITELAQRLAERGHWDEAGMHVTLRPIRLISADAENELATIEPEEDEPPVTIGRVSVFYG